MAASQGDAAAIDGAWQDLEDPSHWIAVGNGRILDFAAWHLRTVARILAENGGILRLCEFGADREWEVQREEQELTVFDRSTDQASTFRRGVPDRPLVVKPLTLPKPSKVTDAQISRIQEEIWTRFKSDQGTLFAFEGGPPGPPREPWREPMSISRRQQAVSYFQVVDSAARNTSFLKSLIREVGWLDVKRFGYPASQAAAVLAEHSRDIELLAAVLPTVERDARTGLMDYEIYALLFDRLQLLLGKRQRYGTHFGWDASGRPFILPVEDSAHVDELRRALGMDPVSTYLSVFGEKEVRFSQACSPTAPAGGERLFAYGVHSSQQNPDP
jgi:Family of unknown function (DUF6624)